MRYNPQKHRKNARRTRFDVAMAERAQRTTAAAPRIKPVVFIVLLGALLLFVAVAWFNGTAWRINTINVVNNDGIPAEQVIGASGLQNEHYQFVDLEQAAKRIDELPGVEAAEVLCRWSWTASCQIAVQPAKPLAMWASALGNVWTDYEGKVQRAPDQLAAKLLIKVTEGEPPPIGVPLDPAILQGLTDIVSSQPNLTRLEYSQEFGLMIKNERGAKIRLGNAEHPGALLEKLQLASSLAEQLGSQGVSPRIIDVRHVKAPFYIK